MSSTDGWPTAVPDVCQDKMQLTGGATLIEFVCLGLGVGLVDRLMARAAGPALLRGAVAVRKASPIAPTRESLGREGERS